MPEVTAPSATVPTAAVNKAAKAAAVSAAAVSDALPTVVETVEVAMEVPAKVVLNQTLVVAVSIVGGAALGAGVLFGVNKWRAHRQLVKDTKLAEELVTVNETAA